MLAHSILARWAPEFAITEAEAFELARAYCGWRAFYPSLMDPKSEAFFALLMTAAAIEGPRIARATARTQAEKRAAKVAAAAAAQSGAPNVVPMDGLRGL